MNRACCVAALLALLLPVATPLPRAAAQQIHRNGFEMGDVAWQKGSADVKYREVVHDLTESFAHTGQRSEHLRIDCETGNHAYYFYPTGKAPVNDELHISVWLRSNRPGFQVLARVVLPKERNPQNLDEPLTTLIRGDLYLDH